MLAAEYKHKARSAAVAENLLRIGVPAYRVAEAVDLSPREVDVIVKYLGEAAPKPMKGKAAFNIQSLISSSVRRNICSTVLISSYKTLRENSPSLSFAELFLHTWKTFVHALHPVAPGRFDMDARNAWAILRFYEDGSIPTAKCSCCGALHPKVDHGTSKCIICYQLQFTNCACCGTEIARSSPLHDRKWRDGLNTGFCLKCRREREKAGESGGWLQGVSHMHHAP